MRGGLAGKNYSFIVSNMKTFNLPIFDIVDFCTEHGLIANKVSLVQRLMLFAKLGTKTTTA